MKTPKTLTMLGCGAALAGFQWPAFADWVNLPSTGAPVVTCNPKTGTPPTQTQSPTLATCKVTGLPDATLPGYILAAKVNSGAAEGANITINGVVVGTRFDRVYCKAAAAGSPSPCDYTQPVVIATRVKMSATATVPSRNTHCPVWTAAPNNECFESNNVFRAVRGANPVYSGSSTTPVTPANEVATSIAYFMGTADGSTDPNTALAKKYLEYAGKTSKGLNQYTPPGNAAYVNRPSLPGDRDATRVSFQSDTNVFDPDSNPPYSYSSQWSPWLLVRQACPNGYNPPASAFNVRIYEGGEEGQVAQNISSTGFACKP